MFDIKEEVLKHESELIALRRDFHQNPELGYHEFRTSKIVSDYLKNLGMEVKNAAKTGVVGVLKGEGGLGKTILLRADMDALPVEEKTGLPFASKTPNVMHACGHDGHTAIQLIVAKILSEHKNEFKGSVKFVFQPNEEEAGALDMINEGILQSPKVDGACALHFIELLLCSVQRGAEFEGLFRQGRTFRLRLIDFFFQPVNLRIQTF